MYRIVFVIITTLAITLGLLIGSLNSETVAVDLLWVQLHWPLGLVLLSAMAVGMLLAVSLAWFFSILPLRVQLHKKSIEPREQSNALKKPNV
jgi:uncharacterized integral membrane protein